jgi:hypothetical protein
LRRHDRQDRALAVAVLTPYGRPPSRGRQIGEIKHLNGDRGVYFEAAPPEWFEFNDPIFWIGLVSYVLNVCGDLPARQQKSSWIRNYDDWQSLLVRDRFVGSQLCDDCS